MLTSLGLHDLPCLLWGPCLGKTFWSLWWLVHANDGKWTHSEHQFPFMGGDLPMDVA